MPAVVPVLAAVALLAGAAMPGPAFAQAAAVSGRGGGAAEGASSATVPVEAARRAAVVASSPEAVGATVDDGVELEAVTATASRLPAALLDPSVAVSTLDRDELDRSAARTVDDALRRVPGFSLFRRLGSGAAHPTTQGVSLRGIGPSGTSRALVLLDGVPVNDPFGGWIPWSRLPSSTLERVDVLRGSGAGLWGNSAMGGVVALTTREPGRRGGSLAVEGGERGGARVESYASGTSGSTGMLADARWMRSGEYPLVRKDDRGPVDVPGGSEHATAGLSLRRPLGRGKVLRFGLRGFHESRDNGTPLARNHTSSGHFASGLDWSGPGGGDLAVDLFGTLQDFASTFPSVAADRASETPAADQFSVPSGSLGGSTVWRADLDAGRLGRHRVVAGLDSMWVNGESREWFRFVDGTFTRRREAGASQATGGLFVEDLFSPLPGLDVTVALRLDHQRTWDGFRRETDAATGAVLVDRALEDSRETLVSPRLGTAFAAASWLTLRSAVYRGFRAPTLNELVRPFRVRNDITEANDGLDAEKLFGVETGFDQQWGRLRSSATLFWNQVDDPVFNVTVGQGPGVVDPCGFVPAGGVCRQRRNLGRTSIPGFEADVSVDLGRGLLATAAWLWSDGRVRSAAAEPALLGNRVPQSPEHQGALGLDFDGGGGPWRASALLRLVGEQFDDDANSRRLDAFASVDLFLARRLGGGLEAYAGVENLFDATVETGRTADGVVSIGAPRLVHAGLRADFE